ncbi:MAG: SDR family NAD(P)-dependent oxidoreductase, partial [Lysobacteraceae bacterium]
MRRVLVTGGNRGLGLEFVRQLLARGDRVVAGCREPDAADQLDALVGEYADRLQVHAVDLAEADSVTALAEFATKHFDGLDLLVNNAGKLVPGERFGSVSADALESSLAINAIAPFLLAQALAPLLKKGERAVV